MQLEKMDHLSELRTMLRDLMRKGYTEEAIACAVKVNQSTISRILSGEIRYPKFHTAIKIQSVHQEYCR